MVSVNNFDTANINILTKYQLLGRLCDMFRRSVFCLKYLKYLLVRIVIM